MSLFILNNNSNFFLWRTIQILNNNFWQHLFLDYNMSNLMTICILWSFSVTLVTAIKNLTWLHYNTTHSLSCHDTTIIYIYNDSVIATTINNNICNLKKHDLNMELYHFFINILLLLLLLFLLLMMVML